MDKDDTLKTLAHKKAEVELLKAQRELAQLNRSIWRDLITSTPLATVMVALIGVLAAWVSGYLNFTRLELQSQKAELERQVAGLEQQKKELSSAVKLAENRLDTALVQSLAKNLGDRSKPLVFGIDKHTLCTEPMDVAFYGGSDQEPEDSTGKDVVLAALKEEKNAVATFMGGTQKDSQANPSSNGRVEEFLDKVLSAIQSDQYSVIKALSNNDPGVAVDMDLAAKSLNLPFYVPSSLYRGVCDGENAPPEMKDRAELSYSAVRETRSAVVTTLRGIGTTSAKYFGVAEPNYPLLYPLEDIGPVSDYRSSPGHD